MLREARRARRECLWKFELHGPDPRSTPQGWTADLGRAVHNRFWREFVRTVAHLPCKRALSKSTALTHTGTHEQEIK